VEGEEAISCTDFRRFFQKSSVSGETAAYTTFVQTKTTAKRTAAAFRHAGILREGYLGITGCF